MGGTKFLFRFSASSERAVAANSRHWSAKSLNSALSRLSVAAWAIRSHSRAYAANISGLERMTVTVAVFRMLINQSGTNAFRALLSDIIGMLPPASVAEGRFCAPA
jgi:hypothetical protein